MSGRLRGQTGRRAYRGSWHAEQAVHSGDAMRGSFVDHYVPHLTIPIFP